MSLRLYLPQALVAGREIALSAGAARHAQVRRVQPGDALVLFNGAGGQWQAQVLAMGRSEVRVRVLRHEDVERELPMQVTLAVGMPANERMDWLVEKATELGVSRIRPLVCERSVLRLSGERAARKREHWQGIACAAAEQCGRTRVPEVEDVRPIDEALRLDAGADITARWLLSLRAGAPVPVAHASGRILVLSGPEGGLSAAEEDAAIAAGYVPTSLGQRVLRAETAPLSALAWLAMGH